MQFDMTRALDVLVVCLPVFAVMAMGKVLERGGRLGPERRSFINWLVYTFALPALIFNEVARQRFATFLNPTLILLPLAAIFVVTVVTMCAARVLRYRGALAAAFVFGTFWANVTYMGFPLCMNAFGREGLARAAVYNAFVMPAFVILAYVLIGLYGAGSARSAGGRMRQAVLNPVVMAAFLGICVALIGELFRDDQGVLALPGVARAGLRVTGSFLSLVGGMGLPMALLAIGASLHWQQSRAHLGALAYTVLAKLVVLPLVALVGLRVFFPAADPIDVGVVVMLSATPNAVASYVVSCQVGVEEGFVSSMLVASTVASIISLPLWLYIVL